MGASKVSAQVETQKSSHPGERKLPPFALSFAAASSFFLCLHLKLLMEQSTAQISFCNLVPNDDQEDSGFMTDDCSSIDECSNRNTEIILRKGVMALSNDAAGGGSSGADLDLVIGPSTCQNIGLKGAETC